MVKNKLQSPKNSTDILLENKVGNTNNTTYSGAFSVCGRWSMRTVVLSP
ncbi:MAG: hypothetical protein LBG58_01200 [Planctomycetaceae bacterium]|nr:hypothetical protein [Planctomycetaceae bacterium]